MRIPLPTKVFLSYLLVVSAGALPTYAFLRIRFERQLQQEAVRTLAERTCSIGRALVELAPDARLTALRRISAGTLEHITYVDGRGRALFDSETSDPTKLGNHLDDAEVQGALRRRGETRDALGIDMPGVGVNTRSSGPDDASMVYVACALEEGQPEQRTSVLRLAAVTDDHERPSKTILGVFRNSQAVAVSVSLLLSLAAALLFVRPLRRLVVTSQQMAAGDYSTLPRVRANDEIGDLARALQQLGVELRRRLATAEAGESLLVQLVQMIRAPLIVADSTGRHVAINGAARQLLDGANVQDHTGAVLFEHESVASALGSSLEQGLPMLAEARLTDAVTLCGWVSVLRRPTPPHYYVFLGTSGVGTAAAVPEGDVRAVPIADLWEEIAREEPDAWGRCLRLGEVPDLVVGDVNDLAKAALTLVLRAAVVAAPAGERVDVTFRRRDTAAGIRVTTAISPASAGAANLLLQPLGTRVEVRGQTSTLWLPLA